MKQLPKIVSEIGINHNGSVDKAKRIIDLVIDAAGDYPKELIYFKLQKRTPKLAVPKRMWNKPKTSVVNGDEITYLEYKYEIEFGLDEYIELDWYVADRLGYSNLFVSVWDWESVSFVFNSFPHWAYIKIPSAHLTNDDLIHACLATGKPLILSTGMSTGIEVDHAVNLVPSSYPLTLMACVATYPTENCDLELNKIKTLLSLYGTWADVGYSGHSPSPFPHCYSMLLGATMIEAHVCESRSDAGSDQAASLEKPGIELIFREAERLHVGMGTGELRVLDSEKSKRESLRG